MSRRFLVSKGTVRSLIRWQDPPPAYARVVEEKDLADVLGDTPRASLLDKYAEPERKSDPPPKRRIRPPKKESSDPFSDATD